MVDFYIQRYSQFIALGIQFYSLLYVYTENESLPRELLCEEQKIYYTAGKQHAFSFIYDVLSFVYLLL